MKKVHLMIVIFVFIVFWSNFIFAEIFNLKLPLEGRKTYQITVGYNGESIFYNNDNSSWIDIKFLAK